MVRKNYYDVTQWHVGNPYEDIGEVINSILADIKLRQTETDINDGVNRAPRFIFRPAIII